MNRANVVAWVLAAIVAACGVVAVAVCRRGPR